MYFLFLFVTITPLLLGIFTSARAHALNMQVSIMGSQSNLCQIDCVTLPKGIKTEQEDDKQQPKPGKEVLAQPQFQGIFSVKKILPSSEYILGVVRPPDYIALSVFRF
jgi:hypothetical protein